MTELLYERQGHIATITLNRPEQRNAFTRTMLDMWAEALHEAKRDDQVRVVVVTGAGKAFCAGGDLTAIMEWQNDDPIGRKNHLWEGVYQVPFALEELDKPVIAAVNGAAVGAGCDMALMCDMRIASDQAMFAETYLLVGLVPGDGGAFYLPRLVGVAKACELLFTGERIDAQEAWRIGLVNRVVPHEELMARTYEMAEKIAKLPPRTVQLTKRLIYQGLEGNLKTALDLASSFMAHVLPSPEAREAVRSTFERTRTSRKKGSDS